MMNLIKEKVALGTTVEFSKFGNGIYIYAGALLLELVAACLMTRMEKGKKSFKYERWGSGI